MSRSFLKTEKESETLCSVIQILPWVPPQKVPSNFDTPVWSCGFWVSLPWRPTIATQERHSSLCSIFSRLMTGSYVGCVLTVQNSLGGLCAWVCNLISGASSNNAVRIVDILIKSAQKGLRRCGIFIITLRVTLRGSFTLDTLVDNLNSWVNIEPSWYWSRAPVNWCR